MTYQPVFFGMVVVSNVGNAKNSHRFTTKMNRCSTGPRFLVGAYHLRGTRVLGWSSDHIINQENACIFTKNHGVYPALSSLGTVVPLNDMGWLVDQTWSKREPLGIHRLTRTSIHDCGLPTSEPYTWWEYGFSMCCWFVISQIGLFCQAEWGGPEVKPRSFASPIEITGSQGNCELGFPTQKDGFTMFTHCNIL